jgi:hypothetical protein
MATYTQDASLGIWFKKKCECKRIKAWHEEGNGEEALKDA